MVCDIQNDKIDIDISKQMYCAKAFAIFFVCFAHCFYENELINRYTGFIGSIGVPMFVIISGYYYIKKMNGGLLILNRAKSLFIPYAFFSIATYFIQCFSGLLDMNISSFLNWIIGNGNWLYFVPALFICYVIFTFYIYNFENEKVLLVLCLLINMKEINTVITFINALPRFLLFFTIGYLLKKYNIIYIMKNSILHILFTIVLLFIMFYFDFPMLLDRVFHIILGIELINICYYLKDISIIQKIGKITYPIYFLHAQVGIGISNIILQILLGYNVKTTKIFIVLFIRPFLAFLVSLLIITVLIKILKGLKLDKLVSYLGVR